MSHHKHDRHGSRHDHHGDRRRFAHSLTDRLEPTGGRHRRHDGPHDGHHRGRRRIFDHGDLRFILLSMIAAKPAHGYDLIKALEDRMGGGYSPSPGAIYPTLTMLEEQGFAQSTAENGKKLYQATQDGVAFLQVNQATVDVIQARINGIARERGVTADPRILRAMENLKIALRLRLTTGPIPDDQVRIIAAAIDAAASTAEQT